MEVVAPSSDQPVTKLARTNCPNPLNLHPVWDAEKCRRPKSDRLIAFNRKNVEAHPYGLTDHCPSDLCGYLVTTSEGM